MFCVLSLLWQLVSYLWLFKGIIVEGMYLEIICGIHSLGEHPFLSKERSCIVVTLTCNTIYLVLANFLSNLLTCSVFLTQFLAEKAEKLWLDRGIIITLKIRLSWVAYLSVIDTTWLEFSLPYLIPNYFISSLKCFNFS